MQRLRFSWTSILFVACLTWTGCGDDGGTPSDAGTDAAGDGGGDAGDAATLPNCEGIGDGASCGQDLICVGGTCGPNRCGDGYLSEETGEVCDDGNNINGDACKDDCTPTCVTSADCDDGIPCNGAETCVPSGCIVGILPTDGTVDCDASGMTGSCYGGLCSPPNCGNSTVDADEDCDDGRNGDQADGCRDDCVFSCTDDGDCDDGDACTGAETCDGVAHMCTTPADLECDDSDDCTADSCDASTGCVNALVDGDGDGYSAATCTTAGLFGDDCDDDNNTVYPGAAELCDMLDNDCDMAVDNDTATVSCMRDQDGDGFGDATMVMEECSCPGGYIPPRADGRIDCEDVGAAAASINPDQMAFSPVGYCPGLALCGPGSRSFDWDCDGTETSRWTGTNTACGLFGIGEMCRRAGWTGDTVPACGATGELRVCASVDMGGGVLACEEISLGIRTQECR